MRALITGGAGFIGSHLAEALVGQGHAVTVLDDLSTGQPANLAAIDGHPGLTLHVGSVTDEGLVSKLVRDADVVYHLAAGVGVRRVLARPVDTMATNVLGTEAVLRAVAVRGTRVVLASSSEVYGQQPRMPLGEEDSLVLGAPSRPRWAYACSKALGEFLASGYHRETGLPVVIVRYFNTIGPRQAGRYGMVVPRLVRQALDGVPLTVHGDGQQTRCFADVQDAVRATIALASAEGLAGRAFNVGTAEEVSILELARRVKRLTGSRSPVTLVPYAEAYGAGFEDVRRRVPDLSRLEAATGYRPRVSLDQALERIIAWMAGGGTVPEGGGPDGSWPSPASPSGRS
jgi:UDP-glucose 4-epimerase